MNNISYLELPEDKATPEFWGKAIKKGLTIGSGYFLPKDHRNFVNYYEAMAQTLTKKESVFSRATSSKIQMMGKSKYKDVMAENFCHNFDKICTLVENLEINQQKLIDENLPTEPAFFIIEDCAGIPMSQLDYLINMFPKTTEFIVYTSKKLFTDIEVLEKSSK